MPSLTLPEVDVVGVDDHHGQRPQHHIPCQHTSLPCPLKPGVPSLPLDIQCLIIVEHLIPSNRSESTTRRTYRVPAPTNSHPDVPTPPDRTSFGRYALVSRYWRSLIQPVLFHKLQFEGLHNLRELQQLCKVNPMLATYTRELRVVSGDWEAPPKSVLITNNVVVPGLNHPLHLHHHQLSITSPPAYRKVAPEPTVLEQFSQAMWTMLQHWNSTRRACAKGKGYTMVPLSLEIEFYISNLTTGLPVSYTPLLAGYNDSPRLEFLESLDIKAHNVSKPTIRRMLPRVFYPAPLIPIVLRAARGLKAFALKAEVLSGEGAPEDVGDTYAVVSVPSAVCAPTDSMDMGCDGARKKPAWIPIPSSATLVKFLPSIGDYGPLRSAQLELFMSKPLRQGKRDLVCRALRRLSYRLVSFKAYVSHISSEIFLPIDEQMERQGAEQEEESGEESEAPDVKQQWKDIKTYSVILGEQDAWGEAYFMSAGHHQSARNPRLERVEPFMKAAVEALLDMPKIEQWEVGTTDMHLTVLVTRSNDVDIYGRHTETAECFHTRSYTPSGAVVEMLRERWPAIDIQLGTGPKMMSWRDTPVGR
ncbi:hypothetical protein BDZ91DRAFT_761164 [Kalaharituber pfeilii]|nr:hypothetical protein BDZ91DRAFT_761164 [Kalaharituber pfeilii]